MRKIYSILSLFFLPAVFFPQHPAKEITLEDIYLKPAFRASSVTGFRSMKDGLHYTAFAEDDKETYVIKYNYESGKAVDTVLRTSWLRPEGSNQPIEVESYEFSEDEKKILISTESERIYRRSSKENYYVFDRAVKKLTRVSGNGKQMYAGFSPDASRVAFVRENNIYLKDLSSGVESPVTTDGKWNFIINGNCDWVYEEEFTFSKAYFWSSDGHKIAYYKFDESRVKEFNMPMYGTLYPTDYRYKYPKPGEENSIVSVHIYDMETKSAVTVDVGKESNQYIPRIQWTKDPSQLCVYRMNRHQNKLELLLADAKTGATKVMMKEENKYYIDINDNLRFLEDKKSFIWSSEMDGFNHLYLYNIDGSPARQITQGSWDVTAFKGYDEKTKTLYYLSTEVSATDRDIYSINADGSNKKKLSSGKGTNNPTFSEGFKFYINTYSDANTPAFITLNNADGKQVRVLEDNNKLKEKLKVYSLSKKEFFSFKTSGNVELNGWVIKPQNFSPAKKYPVFMFVYGGPGSNKVNNNWEGEFMWYQLLAQKGYLVACVDNRGTGARGEEFKKCTYKQLGKLETIDQVEAAKYLGSLPYVDKNRIGIQGWSYGGYMSSLCITKGTDVFKMAIAVAPVTNWRYYDSIYTERYLLTPQENTSGYDDNSPINYAKNLKGKYLLIHGTADDNVHFQNSVEMTTALVKAGKQYDFYMYPDKSHSISGGNTRFHLYSKMTNYILENL